MFSTPVWGWKFSTCKVCKLQKNWVHYDFTCNDCMEKIKQEKADKDIDKIWKT